MKLWSLLFSMRGRIRRRDYWIWTLAINAICMVLYFSAYKLWGKAPRFVDQLKVTDFFHPDGFTIAYLAIYILQLWPITCVLAKRWHDRNRSAYWAVAYTAMFVVYNMWLHGLNETSATHIAVGYIFRILTIVAPLWVFIDCGILEGTKGANKFGRSPKEEAIAEEVF